MGKIQLGHAMANMVITCSHPEALLQKINKNNITVKDLHFTDELTISLRISYRDIRRLSAITKQGGADVLISGFGGLYCSLRQLLHRPVIILSTFLLLITILLLQDRILSVTVEGNYALTDQEILDAAELCGLRFGTAGNEIQNIAIKNSLLTSIPQLQWAGVQINGCTATIYVDEQSETEDPSINNNHIRSIVASQDGIITSVTVHKGNALCQPGQAVRSGQMLVSGYLDHGLLIETTQADAEIVAQTRRSLELVSPRKKWTRGDVLRSQKRYSLMIGKKIINFYKDSGIPDSSCAKIYVCNYLNLPGGFQLPVAFVTERLIYHDLNFMAASHMDDEIALEQLADQYLSDTMIAGTILSRAVTGHSDEVYNYLTGEYICLEMIAQVKDEENIYDYGKSHRNNR